MTLWFWNTAPIPRTFLPAARRIAPAAKVLILSDDVHFLRLERLQVLRLHDAASDAERRGVVLVQRSGGAVEVEVVDGMEIETIDDDDDDDDDADDDRVNGDENDDDKDAKGGGEEDDDEEGRSARVRAEELRFYRAADAVVTVTDQDRCRIRSELSKAANDDDDGDNDDNDDKYPARSELPLLVGVPMVVSSAAPPPPPPQGGMSTKRSNVVFVGNGANPINFRSMVWFLQHIWPAARAQIVATTSVGSSGGGGGGSGGGGPRTWLEPTVWLNVIGADWEGLAGAAFPAKAKGGGRGGGGGGGGGGDMASAMRMTAAGVRVVGFLSERDLEAALAGARVFASPMQASTGINTKNLLALRHGLPLVTTTVGAEGMRLEGDDEDDDKKKGKEEEKKEGSFGEGKGGEGNGKEGEDCGATARRFLGGQGRRRHEKLAVAVADEPEEFAQALAEEYHRPANSADEAGAAGRAHLQAHFSRSAQDGALNNLLAAIL